VSLQATQSHSVDTKNPARMNHFEIRASALPFCLGIEIVPAGMLGEYRICDSLQVSASKESFGEHPKLCGERRPGRRFDDRAREMMTVAIASARS
jgi:hypothetical protein